MGMKLRFATPNDIPTLFAMSCRIHRLEPYTSLIPAHERERFLRAYAPGSKLEKKFTDKLARFIATPEHWVYIAEVDGEIAGYRLAERQGTDIYMHGLFVDPDYQGRGIGRALFTEPLLAAKVGDTIHLTVLKGNDRARQLYESEGFVVVNENPKTFYGAMQEDMVKTIPV